MGSQIWTGERGAGCQRISGKSLSFPKYPSSLCPTELDLNVQVLTFKKLGLIGLTLDVCDLCNHHGLIGLCDRKAISPDLGKKSESQERLSRGTFLGPSFRLIPGHFPTSTILTVSLKLLSRDLPGGPGLRLWAPHAGGPVWIPGQGTRSQVPQLKIPHAAIKTRCSQINKYLKNKIAS